MIKLIKLSEIVKELHPGFASGENIESGFAQVRMNNVATDGSWNWEKIRRVPATDRQFKKCILKGGDILFNCTNSPQLVGKTAIFEDIGEPALYSNHFFRIRLFEECAYPEYVTWFLIHCWDKRVFFDKCKAWVNQASVRKDDLLSLKIPLPPLDTQKQIAAILEKSDKLRKQCQQVEQELNTLAQSVFLEIFGDPETNPKGWKRCFYKDLGKVQTGNTPPRSESSSYGEYIEWIKSDNIRENNIYLSESKEGLSERGMKLGRVAPKGSVLVTCIAGSSKTIGNAAIANRDVTFNQQINSITPYEDVEPIFLYGLCRAMKRIVQNSTTSGMKRIITKSNFEKIPVFKPPLAEQMKFSKAFRLIDSLSARQKLTTLDAKSLFCALLAKSFNGDFRFNSMEKINKLEAQQGHV